MKKKLYTIIVLIIVLCVSVMFCSCSRKKYSEKCHAVNEHICLEEEAYKEARLTGHSYSLIINDGYLGTKAVKVGVMGWQDAGDNHDEYNDYFDVYSCLQIGNSTYINLRFQFWYGAFNGEVKGVQCDAYFTTSDFDEYYMIRVHTYSYMNAHFYFDTSFSSDSKISLGELYPVNNKSYYPSKTEIDYYEEQTADLLNYTLMKVDTYTSFMGGLSAFGFKNY